MSVVAPASLRSSTENRRRLDKTNMTHWSLDEKLYGTLYTVLYDCYCTYCTVGPSALQFLIISLAL